MEYTIDDLLEMLQNPNQDNSEDSLSAKEIWDMIASRESWEKMGFSNEEELKDFIKNNPYENL